MDWIVFGDDWGRHVSTTQHLILNLPAGDRVIWLDSIGMREPKLRTQDLQRIWDKARGFFDRRSGGGGNGASAGQHYRGSVETVERIKPQVIPFHFHPLARRYNARWLGRQINKRLVDLDLQRPVLLTVNPLVIQYVGAIPHEKAAYLRLDNYAHFPGVDADLVHRSEPRMFDYADAIFATARALFPGGALDAKSHYLPQGVQYDHFASTSLEPAGRPVAGFYGLISEYIDFDLVEKVARAMPDWRFEFVGTMMREQIPQRILSIDNITISGPVPFAELPRLLERWTAAWAPYVLDDHTRASNPLKVREYLASGLPAHCTPIPEATTLPALFISDEAEQIANWLARSLAEDSPEKRHERRLSVQGESWASRSTTLHQVMEAL